MAAVMKRLPHVHQYNDGDTHCFTCGKPVPQKTPEHTRMEAFYATRGVVGCWRLDRNGSYVNKFAYDAWAAWQAAQSPT